MTPRIQASCYSHDTMTPGRHVTKFIDLSETEISLICNDDHQLAAQIVIRLRNRGAQKIRLCYPTNQDLFANANIDAIKLPCSQETQIHFESCISNADIVISLLYNNYEKQKMLLNACTQQKVALLITWDSGMELDHYVRDKQCPRTRLHKKLLNHRATNKNKPEATRWILFQVGIFDEEILKNDISTVTTAFNSPNQFIFLNITVKEDLAQLIVESIMSREIELDRNYVVGDFVAHTFLGHVYQVATNGVRLNLSMPAELSEFEITNALRLSGIVSARPLPRILYPGCSLFFYKLGIEVSFQHDAAIYKILKHHRRTTFKEWIHNKFNDFAY
ncbi:19180_t:CDS:2 [Funneliformis geosporum]|uniref:16542_t:CDS:1 n=1 Tax=Funneliformis geosporum TaxID=1117311 RepID=A0A9W4SI19_9GLOM|nr:19180_t:CDS:2 [Funneliformis geosporum]CAI2169754.1 16542_t:CDS:2 [Funneliformis geosporum]